MELKNYFVQDDAGNILSGATCYLYVRGTESLVEELQEANGLALGNPFVSDSQGLVQFAAPNGLYDLRAVKGNRDYRLRLQFNDVTETSEAIQNAVGALEERLKNSTDPSKGVGILGYLPGGAGAVGTTLGERLRRVIYVVDYMSPAERADALRSAPLLDHTLAWRKAVAACAEGGTVYGDPRHTYSINWQLDGYCVPIEKGITIDLQWAKSRYKTYSDANPAFIHSPAFFFRGSTGVARTIVPTTGQPVTVTCSTPAQAADFAAGDRVLITTDAARVPWNFPDGLYASFTGYGELQTVLAVNVGTGVVTLSRPLEGVYLSTATITKLNLLQRPKLLNAGVAIEVDPGVISTKALSENCGHFASFYCCEKPEATDISVGGFRLFVTMFWMCWMPHVQRVKGYLPNPIYPTNGGHAYVIRHHLCFGALSSHNEGVAVRHLIDYTTSHGCVQHDNVCHGPIAGAYVAHGLGERRITSMDDTSHGGASAGWNYGNEAFRGAYEGKIKRFKYTGAGAAINVTTLSGDVSISDPDVRMIGASGAAVRISSGASNVRIKGGILDKSAVTVAGDVVSIFPAFGTSQVVPGTLVLASAAMGTDAVVTVVMSVAHGLVVGDGIYVGIRAAGSPDSQYAGHWTVASVSTTSVANDTFTFVRTGVTTENLSYAGVTNQVWREASFKPVNGVRITGVRLVASPVAGSSTVSGSCAGELEIDDCTHVMSAPGAAIALVSRYSDEAPQTIKLTRNYFTGAHTRSIDLDGEYAKKSLTIRGNTSNEYTDAFLNLTGTASQKRARYVIGRQYVLAENNTAAAAPINGLVTMDLWNAVGLGASVYGNTYPANAAVANTYNKNWEYGSLTLGLQGGSTAGTASYTSRAGNYQMDGYSLNVRGRLNWTGFTGTGQMQITGMPYDAGAFPMPCEVGDTTLPFTGQLAPRWSGSQVHLRQLNGGVQQDVPVSANGDVLFSSRLALSAA